MSIGPMQIAIILLIALIVFGPKRLPQLGKSMGEAIRGFKKGLDTDIDDEPKKKISDEKNDA